MPRRAKTTPESSIRDILSEFFFFNSSKNQSIQFSSRISALLDESKGVVLAGNEESRDRSDRFIPPTVLDVEKTDPFMHDEIFGPVLPIITVKNLCESIDFINKGEKPLAAYIFTKDEAKVQRFLNETTSGGVTVNDVIMHVAGKLSSEK